MSLSPAERYRALRRDIDAAARAVHRLPEEITLIAVSKTFPPEAIQGFYDAGVRDFGENYVQEWAEKQQRLPEDIVWHMIGDVQSNKTRQVAEHAAWVHTVSRAKIAERLAAQRPADLPPLNVCIEINISGEAQKHGIAPSDAAELAQRITDLPPLRLRGIMCVPSAAEESIVRAQMQAAQALYRDLQAQGFALDALSMGMSGDWRLALEYGTTHLRIGSALFGHRDYAIALP
ncbi:MAG: YggS family pyridoxal phosphate-dependent enzyme [Neisseria sp.]|nr:YggS family pyridoxal phosphate-dependent enzyme [Neisseria sp.]